MCQVALNPVSWKLLLDLSPVNLSMANVTRQVVEVKRGKMVTANKLTVLQKINMRRVSF
jgi:hypothetical protein